MNNFEKFEFWVPFYVKKVPIWSPFCSKLGPHWVPFLQFLGPLEIWVQCNPRCANQVEVVREEQLDRGSCQALLWIRVSTPVKELKD